MSYRGAGGRKPGAGDVAAVQQVSDRVGLANMLLRARVNGGGVVKLVKPVNVAFLNSVLSFMGDAPIEAEPDLEIGTVVVARDELTFTVSPKSEAES